MTQAGLAEVLGCSQSLVALIESGKRSVSRANAEAWSEKTGIPVMALMFPEHAPSEGDGAGGVEGATNG